MTTNSNLAVASTELAPPLYASPWLALFHAFKNGWRRLPERQKSDKNSHH